MPIGNGTQVRTLTVATDGGSLAASTVILRASARYPGIAAVTAGPGGTLRIMALSEADEGYVTVTVDQVSIVSGAVQRVLYRRDTSVRSCFLTYSRSRRTRPVST
jgi:hypothetical protein